jgi:hypothetical protein
MIDLPVGMFIAGADSFSSIPVSTDFVWLVCPFWSLFLELMGVFCGWLGVVCTIKVK